MNPNTGEIYQGEAKPGHMALSAEEADYLKRLRKSERVAALLARRAEGKPIKFHYRHQRKHR